MYYHSYRSKRNELLAAYLFAFTLALFVVGSLVLAYASAGPVVLGTEMNANGSVEYLCLGRGCESMTAMDW